MVVYNPHKNRNSSTCDENMNEEETSQIHSCHCHCDCDHDPVITITTDEAPVLETDILYGPPGKDGTINGYNKVTINSGSNIDVVTDKNNITINSVTYIEPHRRPDEDEFFESVLCDECSECTCHEQAKPKSKWIINHCLNKYPSVTVVDECNREIICEVKYISKNEIHLLFNGKFRGKAYLN